MADYAHPDVLVDTAWLAEHLQDCDPRLIEVDMSPEHYQTEHMPGAIFWNIFTDLLKPNLAMNLDQQAFEALLSRSGISPDTTVIAYGSYPGTGAWIFWLLKLFGHGPVYVLNGGFGKWKAEGRALSTEPTVYPSVPYQSQPQFEELRASQQDVQSALSQADQAILDVRTLAEYSGEQYLMEPPQPGERAGHIPSAVHVDNSLVLNPDRTFKSAEALRVLYESVGITPEKEIFPYCAIGARSGSTCFVLKYLLGYPNVRNYDGSWNEWSRLPDASVESEA